MLDTTFSHLSIFSPFFEPELMQKVQASATLMNLNSGDVMLKVGKAIVALRMSDDVFQNPIAEVNNALQPGLYQPVPPTAFVYPPIRYLQYRRLEYSLSRLRETDMTIQTNCG